ncbi:MAG: pantoate--beta-alanine ligase [Vicinamibacterales bacterium]
MNDSPTVTLTTIAALRAHLAPFRQAGTSIGFVPTMGALHEGHAALIREARRGNDCVAVSIFVNPLQFDRKDDLDHYPRTLDSDLALCRDLGVDTVFAPTAAEMYPEPPVMTVHVGELGRHLCGASRPGHFEGVATVVLKLLQIVQPDRAYFGEKDAQQLAVIRRLVTDFNLPVEVVGMPTVREPDGLAMSSRNRRLSPAGRTAALALVRALTAARQAIEAGERSPLAITAIASGQVVPDGNVRVDLDYLEVVDPRTMQPVEEVAGPVLVAGALWVDGVRLIDNLTAQPTPAPVVLG